MHTFSRTLRNNRSRSVILPVLGRNVCGKVFPTIWTYFIHKKQLLLPEAFFAAKNSQICFCGRGSASAPVGELWRSPDQYAAASVGCPLAQRARVTSLTLCMHYSFWSIVHSYFFMLPSNALIYCRILALDRRPIPFSRKMLRHLPGKKPVHTLTGAQWQLGMFLLYALHAAQCCERQRSKGCVR